MEVKKAATHTERPVHMPKSGVADLRGDEHGHRFRLAAWKETAPFGARVDQISEPFVAVLLSGAKVLRLCATLPPPVALALACEP
jgi:hypothetical protein